MIIYPLVQVYSPLYRNWANLVVNAQSLTQDLLVDFSYQASVIMYVLMFLLTGKCNIYGSRHQLLESVVGISCWSVDVIQAHVRCKPPQPSLQPPPQPTMIAPLCERSLPFTCPSPGLWSSSPPTVRQTPNSTLGSGKLVTGIDSARHLSGATC